RKPQATSHPVPSPTMRVLYTLLLAAATVLIITDSCTAQASATLASSGAVLPIDGAQAVGVDNRFLRDHKVGEQDADSEEECEEDNEERGLDPMKIDDLAGAMKLDDLLDRSKLEAAMTGDKAHQANLFNSWLAAPKQLKFEAISKIALGQDGLGKYQKLFKAWNAYKGRTRTGFPVSYTGPSSP
ncbi:hypothetical protein L914_16095, partial [Phytophthora nicotianae]